MSLYRRVRKRSNLELALQWDGLAHLRYNQLRSGEDITFHNILVPKILEFMGEKKFRLALDIGCGTGVLTSMLSNRVDRIDGIDISSVSIGIAQESNLSERMRFFNASIEDYSDRVNSRYDLIVANMVLMDVMDIDIVISSVERMLKPGGLFVFTMTNPVFWASYFGYESEDWYDYNQEIFIEGPFIISKDIDKSVRLKSVHVHRPISTYINAFTRNNLRRLILSEPMPDQDLEQLYPKKWKFPRYIVGRCVAGPKVRVI